MTRSSAAARAAVLLLALTSPLAAQEAPRPPAPAASRDATRVEVELPTGSLELWSATDLIRAGAQAVGGVLTVDAQVDAMQIRLGLATSGETVTLTWGVIKTLLDFHDIVVVESQPTADAPFVIRVHHRRNITQREGPPWRVVDAKALPAHDELVTALFRIEHGAGNSIFMSVRALLTRDVNRIGNILYVPGPEVIVIVDLAAKVRYYADVIAGLDVPPAGASRAFRLRFADPQVAAAALSRLLDPPSAPRADAPQALPVGPASAPLRIVADPRTAQLLVTGTPGVLAEAERLLATLDVEAVARDVVLRVYPVDVEDVRAVRAFVERTLSAVSSFTGTQCPQVFEGPTPKSLAVVARTADLPRVEEALEAALGK